MGYEETSDLLRKADALMQRHKSSSGTAPPLVTPTLQPVPPLQTESRTSDDDVPILTDIVTDENKSGTVAPIYMQKHMDALKAELALWLSRELPSAVLKVTDGLADQLMRELTLEAEENLLPRLIARLDGSNLLKAPSELP